MTAISIIVPIYHGKKYIQGLIHQVELCQSNLTASIEVELVLSNDAPEEPLDENYCSDKIKITVLNTTVNRGIQGARIEGLKVCKGDYITFLDQDDRVSPYYLKSQMEAIKDADAVVCCGINENKLIYNIDKPFEETITKERLLKKGNPILSVGQVLIKKSSISSIWLNNIQKYNGADDFLLWACMMGENRQFALNQEVLYERVVTGYNASMDTNSMIASVHEAIEILKRNNVFQGEDLNLLSLLEEKLRHEVVKNLDKFRMLFFTLNTIMELKEQNISISEKLEEKGIHRVAIYGAGYIGKRICAELMNSRIEADFFIDRNAMYLKESLPAYTVENIPHDVDAIIVTVVQGGESIVHVLKERFHNVEIIHIKEFLAEISRS